MKLGRTLPRKFYDRPCLTVARELVGKILVRRLPDGSVLCGRLVETEAYLGDGSDPGSHSHRGQTPRNASMFGPPGGLYAYRSYGIHTCANVVCEGKGSGAAVLIRAVEPLTGLERMRVLRGLSPSANPRLIARGPGRLCQAFRIGCEHDGLTLLGGELTLRSESAQMPRRLDPITEGPRVGLTRGANLHYRFAAADSIWVSAWRPGRLEAGGGRSPRPG